MDFPIWACRTSLRRNYPPDAVLGKFVIRLQQVKLQSEFRVCHRSAALSPRANQNSTLQGALEIHIEYTAETTAPGANRNDSEIAYRIEWLSVEKAREVLEDKAATIVDVEALQCQTSHVTHKRRGGGRADAPSGMRWDPATRIYRENFLRSHTTASFNRGVTQQLTVLVKTSKQICVWRTLKLLHSRPGSLLV